MGRDMQAAPKSGSPGILSHLQAVGPPPGPNPIVEGQPASVAGPRNGTSVYFKESGSDNTGWDVQDLAAGW
jgi:hypothetical protein